MEEKKFDKKEFLTVVIVSAALGGIFGFFDSVSKAKQKKREEEAINNMKEAVFRTDENHTGKYPWGTNK